jgi:hypothetical protein
LAADGVGQVQGCKSLLEHVHKLLPATNAGKQARR